MTCEARSGLSSESNMPVAEVNPQYMNTKEIIQQQKERKLQNQKTEELKQPKEKEIVKDKNKDNLAATKASNYYQHNNNNKLNNVSNNNTLNDDMTKQNMNFYNSVKTELNDNRLIDMQRESDALKDHNQTLVAQLAEKDILVKMYLSKIESLSEQFTKLEGKITSTQISMQQNTTP